MPLQVLNWEGEMVDYQPQPRRPLPNGNKTNGRPVWEPPALDYDDMIDQEGYDKRREAVLKYYKGDVVKTTKYFDIIHELVLVGRARDWAMDERGAAEDEEGIGYFFAGLLEELLIDETETFREYEALDIQVEATEDGGYIAYNWVDPPRSTPSSSSNSVAEESTPSAPSVTSAPSPTTEAPRTKITEQPLHHAPPTLTPTTPSPTERTPLLQPTSSLTEGTSGDQHSPNNDEASTSLSTIMCGCACQGLGTKLAWTWKWF